MPSGKDFCTSAKAVLALSITVSAFDPTRCNTMPLATSPSPFNSVIPRRSSGMISTCATSDSRSGTPDLVIRVMFSISAVPFR